MKETIIGVVIQAIGAGLRNIFGPEGQARRKERRARRKTRRLERKQNRETK